MNSVNNSIFIKERLRQEFIPRILELIEKEETHLNWLINNNAPEEMIERSRHSLNYFNERHEEFVEYISED